MPAPGWTARPVLGLACRTHDTEAPAADGAPGRRRLHRPDRAKAWRLMILTRNHLDAAFLEPTRHTLSCDAWNWSAPHGPARRAHAAENSCSTASRRPRPARGRYGRADLVRRCPTRRATPVRRPAAPRSIGPLPSQAASSPSVLRRSACRPARKPSKASTPRRSKKSTSGSSGVRARRLMRRSIFSASSSWAILAFASG